MLIMVNAALRQNSVRLIVAPVQHRLLFYVSIRRKSGMFFTYPFAPKDRGHPQRTGRVCIAGTQKRMM
jgi:hypothetical protein